MQLITAPSKTQNFNGRPYNIFTIPACMSTSKKVNTTLKAMSSDAIATLMKTSPKLTESTHRRIHSFETPFSLNNAKQALFTFQGDAYAAITAEIYTEDELQYAQDHLNILSGLYGLLRPLDLMQPYRLEMGAKLPVGDCKNLYQLWKNEITETLNTRLALSQDKTVVNLASTEYSKVIDRKQLNGKIVEVIFQQEHNAKIKTIPIHSKRARGLMIHFAIINKAEQANDLKRFNLGGYSLAEGNTTEDRWTFFKKS
ncbi:MAG: cytoplasmic iron level regulating protein YaaA (DUF328/UPF0246 family) [Desulforhopalus sp.]|jgi:cytoplasmic iron level regulating protein YaaA (DUF328/UPF0246 family)